MATQIAVLEAKRGSEEALARTLRELVRETSGEEGALGYAVHRNRSRPTRFVVYERYADQAALERHMATPYVVAALRSFGQLLACPPTVEVLDAFGAYGRAERSEA